MATGLKRILLAEDNPNDAELALCALDEHRLAHEVILVRDGAEALDYLLRRGAHAGRPPGNPVVEFLAPKMPCVDADAKAYVVKPVDIEQYLAAVKQLGQFWAQVNEPPPARLAA
jgi:CheY-like chemotaxis protein